MTAQSASGMSPLDWSCSCSKTARSISSRGGFRTRATMVFCSTMAPGLAWTCMLPALHGGPHLPSPRSIGRSRSSIRLVDGAKSRDGRHIRIPLNHGVPARRACRSRAGGNLGPAKLRQEYAPTSPRVFPGVHHCWRNPRLGTVIALVLSRSAATPRSGKRFRSLRIAAGSDPAGARRPTRC